MSVCMGMGMEAMDDDSRRDGRARSGTIGEQTGLARGADEVWVRSQAEAAFALWVLAK